VPPARGSIFIDADPALKTPGYFQTVPPGPAAVAPNYNVELIHTQSWEREEQKHLRKSAKAMRRSRRDQ